MSGIGKSLGILGLCTTDANDRDASSVGCWKDLRGDLGKGYRLHLGRAAFYRSGQGRYRRRESRGRSWSCHLHV
jgi:hypothetical protein